MPTITTSDVKPMKHTNTNTTYTPVLDDATLALPIGPPTLPVAPLPKEEQVLG